MEIPVLHRGRVLVELDDDVVDAIDAMLAEGQITPDPNSRAGAIVGLVRHQLTEMDLLANPTTGGN